MRVLLFCDKIARIQVLLGSVGLCWFYGSVPVGAGDPVRHAWVGMVADVGNDIMVSKKKK